MAVLIVASPQPAVYLRTRLYGVGRAGNDAEFRTNLRLIAAIILAHWDDSKPDLSGVRGHIFDMLTSEHMYTKGYAKSSDERLWFTSYIGYETITSKWAKENHPECKGYICIRLFNQDKLHNEIDHHTIQLYF